MNQIKIIRGAFALPFLLVGSVALAQGAQQPSGSQPSGTGSQTETQRLREQEPLSGSQAGRTGTTAPSGTRQQQPGMQQQQQQPPGMQQPGQPGVQQPGMQAAGQGAAFQNVDKDGDGEITRTEIRDATQDVVGKWDHNQDGKVTRLEALGAIAKNVDKNGDQAIDEQEFQSVQQQWMPQGEAATFAEWDGNSDGKLDYLEFADGLVTSRVARKFDQNRDDQISERELQNGLISALDRDGNRSLSQQEWPIS